VGAKARRLGIFGTAMPFLILALGACSSTSHDATAARTPQQQCAAYQEAHYPKARVRVRAIRPKVACSINIGPVVTCTRSGRESTYYPKEMLDVALASNGAGRVVRTFRQVCSADETMTTEPLPPPPN
jgi:hypothetical protein